MTCILDLPTVTDVCLFVHLFKKIGRHLALEGPAIPIKHFKRVWGGLSLSFFSFLPAGFGFGPFLGDSSFTHLWLPVATSVHLHAPPGPASCRVGAQVLSQVLASPLTVGFTEPSAAAFRVTDGFGIQVCLVM